EMLRQRHRAEQRPVVELRPTTNGLRDRLPPELQRRDIGDELRILPRLGGPPRLLQRDDVCRRLFDDVLSLPLQLADEDRLAGARSAGEDEMPGHGKPTRETQPAPETTAATRPK